MSVQIVIHHPVQSQVSAGETVYSFEPINRADTSDVAHFVATYNQALRHASGENIESVDIHLGARTQPRYLKNAQGEDVLHSEGGWLEHSIIVRYKSGRMMHIGAIQRRPGAQSEFHS